VRAVLLNREYADENHHRRWNDVGLEQRCHGLETFDGAEHGDGWRDHAVAIKQRGAEMRA